MSKERNREIALALCRAANALAEIEESELERLGVTLTPEDLLQAAGKINQPVPWADTLPMEEIEPF